MLDRKTCNQFAASLARLVKPLQSPDRPLRRPELGILASLRRGLGKTYGHAGLRDGWVLKTLEVGYSDSDLEWACHVASFFASHPIVTEDRFAAALRLLWKNQDEAASVARRFAVLLEADAQDLPVHLRHSVRLLKANEIGLDWATLLFDLTRWHDPDRKIQRRWSRDFWTESRFKQPTTHQPITADSTDLH